MPTATMPTATLPLPATAARFGLIDATGHAYRGLSFSTDRAARGYLDRQAPSFRRMLATAGYKVGPVATTSAAPCCPADEPAPCTACSTAHAEPVKVARPPARPASQATTRLTLAIGETSYAVRRLDVADRSFGVVKALRLRRLDNGELYDVAQTIDGHTCTCGDATFRHEDGNARCKHVRALVAWGLLA